MTEAYTALDLETTGLRNRGCEDKEGKCGGPLSKLRESMEKAGGGSAPPDRDR